MEAYAITATRLIRTDKMSFRFMAQSGAPRRDYVHLSKQFGVASLRPYHPKEVNPFSLMNGGPAQSAEKRIELTIVGIGRGIIYHTVMDQLTNFTDAVDAFEDLPKEGFVVLTDRILFNKVLKPMFDGPLTKLGWTLKVHHFDGTLSTN